MTYLPGRGQGSHFRILEELISNHIENDSVQALSLRIWTGEPQEAHNFPRKYSSLMAACNLSMESIAINSDNCLPPGVSCLSYYNRSVYLLEKLCGIHQPVTYQSPRDCSQKIGKYHSCFNMVWPFQVRGSHW